MDYYIYNADLHFSGKKIWYKDINSKQQLMLTKLDILFPIENEDYLEYSNIFNKIISESVENKEDFYKIDLIEYVLFLTKLRIISIGNDLELVFKNPENSNEENTKITIDLNYFIKTLYENSSELLKDNIIKFKDIEIEVGWPSIKSERIFLNIKENHTEHLLSTIPEYIKNIKIKNSKILIENFNNEEKIDFYNKLPIKLRNLIQNKVFEAIKILSEKNLFGISQMDYLKFNFYNKSHQHIIRLLFSENLINIYQEYYILASKNINPSYIDKLTIAERRVYFSFIQEEIKAMNEKNSNNNNKEFTDLSSLIGEFGEQ